MQAIELFSCAGGMAEGFRRAGIEFSMAFDRDPDACASYAANLGCEPVQVDIHDLAHLARYGWTPGPLDLLVADPPCTPYSQAGKRRGFDDERDGLVATRDLILFWRPRAYLIGNVPGLDDARFLPELRELLAPLADVGYCVADYANLDAANHGVPQRRRRPFWFGHRGGPCLRWPRPTHGDPRALATGQLFEAERLAPWISVREALAVLPTAMWGQPLHEYRVHKRHRPSHPDEPSHTMTSQQRSVGAGVIEWPWDRPSTTVCCRPEIPPPGHHGNTGYQSGPDAIRLSERAAAVLQGFEPSWTFCGKSQRARWRQIGQAMPPALAQAVAGSIRAWFAAQGRNPAPRPRPAAQAEEMVA